MAPREITDGSSDSSSTGWSIFLDVLGPLERARAATTLAPRRTHPARISKLTGEMLAPVTIFELIARDDVAFELVASDALAVLEANAESVAAVHAAGCASRLSVVGSSDSTSTTATVTSELLSTLAALGVAFEWDFYGFTASEGDSSLRYRCSLFDDQRELDRVELVGRGLGDARSSQTRELALRCAPPNRALRVNVELVAPCGQMGFYWEAATVRALRGHDVTISSRSV